MTEKVPNFGRNKKGRIYLKGVQIPDVHIIEILLSHESGVSPSQIAEKVGHHVETIKNYIKKFENGENVFHCKRKEMESGYHTQPTNVDYLCNLVLSYPAVTINKIRKQYVEVFGEISTSMIYYILTRHLKFKWKKTQMLELARKTDSIKQLRDEYEKDSFFEFFLIFLLIIIQNFKFLHFFSKSN